ncbi:UDP-glucose 4-epimerase GalE [Paenibacillus sp. strain BS8-2]
MTILITGGAGYIGSHTCVELLRAGHDIVVIDNLSNSHSEALDRVAELGGKAFPVYIQDLTDRQALRAIFRVHDIDAVIHFAGLKAVGESVQLPMKYYRQNLISTMMLCETMDEFGVRRLLFSSSATVYGLPKEVPISEQAEVGAVNPYGRTKQMIEQMLEDLVSSDPRWSIGVLRYFNPVGAHVSGRIGEDPSGVPNNLLPYITQVAIGKLKEVAVFGDDYDTPDGTGVRDYIHVVDLANGHLRALDKLSADRGLHVYNLGTGCGFSVMDMIRAFERASGRSIPYRIVARRPGDVGACYANPSKANAELGWRAERGIDEMCADAWRWQLANPRGYASSMAYAEPI